LTIKYVRLPKCAYVKLKPQRNIFFEVKPVKRCLEENLSQHSTLTEGDQLTVWYRGNSFLMRVTSLKAQGAVEDEEQEQEHGGQKHRGCSLIDADVEVDLELSEETDPSNCGKETTPHSFDEAVNVALPRPEPVLKREKIEGGGKRPLGERFVASCDVVEKNSMLLKPSAVDGGGSLYVPTLAEIEPEPPASSADAVLLRIRLPKGEVLNRRFLRTSSLQQIFYFIAATLSSTVTSPAERISSESIQLSVRSVFPPKSIRFEEATDSSSGETRTLTDIGLFSAQETVFVSYRD
jgi:hypothetical protein